MNITHPRPFTVRDLIAHLSEFPLDAEVHYADPNFGDRYMLVEPDKYTFRYVEVPSMLLIHFPLEEDCNNGPAT